ncbi:MAG: GerMN domain-containing protein [Spirochaetales bacterium]|jgi:hypothetical protein|nr:GerMN domain-containing protein [Spirochaetales bacterium]
MKHTVRLNKPALLWGGILLLIFAFSLGAFFLSAYSRVYRVFFYPALHQTFPLQGERRLLPRRRGGENNAEEYLREWVLGPQKIDHLRLFPGGTRLISCLFREGVLYLNFSVEFLTGQDSVPLSPGEILGETVRGIRFNFPEVRECLFFVDGEPLGEEDYS